MLNYFVAVVRILIETEKFVGDGKEFWSKRPVSNHGGYPTGKYNKKKNTQN